MYTKLLHTLRAVATIAVMMVLGFGFSAVTAVAQDPATLDLQRLFHGREDDDDRDEERKGGRGFKDGACSRTARVLLRACKDQAEAGYLVEVGNCLNLSDPTERAQCIEEARTARAEARTLCKEQFQARLDVCEELGQDPYDPEIDPNNFLSPEEAAAKPNPFFPLVPGARWVYQGGAERIEVTVLAETKEIQGVESFRVRDLVTENGETIEDTEDWYAVDKDGNVHYMGELAKNYENGELVNLDGSWQAGVDGAKSGIIMKADPEVGDVYRQEFLLTEAEDVARVASLDGTGSAPAGNCDGNCLVTEEFTPIEPDNVGKKYYKSGVGLLFDVSADGSRAELIEFDIPGSGAPSSARPSRPASEVQANPNPLRGETAIQFENPREGPVSAGIFDMQGRKIRTLVDGSLGAGSHTVRWDRTDGSARRVPAGVYFVHVRADQGTLSRRIVVTD